MPLYVLRGGSRNGHRLRVEPAPRAELRLRRDDGRLERYRLTPVGKVLR